MASEERFLQAEHFVAAVQSRLARDPASVPPRLWVLQQQPAANRLWALRQQALVGSCEAARAAKDYPGTAGRAAGRAGPCMVSWASGCCLAVVRSDSRMKLWQMLGDLPPADAKAQFVRALTDLLPEWADPQPPDAALLRTWTPDDDSDECAACGEAFTLLNRRHHCRRCLRLVCAVCSPHALPLRVFAQRTARRQRLCVDCYAEMGRVHLGRAPGAGGRAGGGAGGGALSRASSSADSCADSDSAATVSLAGSSSHSLRLSPGPSPNDEAASPRPSPGPSLAAAGPSTAIHTGPLELLHAAGGFRKAWRAYFFVLLVRKGSLGMFPSPPPGADAGAGPTDPRTGLRAAGPGAPEDGHARPAAVFKLSGYALRVRAQKRRPHQFRLAHATKKPLQLAAASMDDLRAWLAALACAIESADELERAAAGPHGVRPNGTGRPVPAE